MIKQKIKILHKFNNLLIKKGKKAKANTLMLNTFFYVKRKTKNNPINLVSSVLKILTPGITTRKTVIAGRLYHLPSPITKNKSIYFSSKWLQQAAIENKELKQKNLDFKMAEECFKVLKKKGQSLLMLKQHNKVVSENRPFLRFVRRKFKPRLPRKVWLRKKQMLWLSRRKKFRKKYLNNFDYNLTLKGPRKVWVSKNKKFSKKKTRYVSKLFRIYRFRIKKKLIKLGQEKLKEQRRLYPEKFLKADRLRKKMLEKMIRNNQPREKKFTRYEQRSKHFKKKYYHKNKATNKQNRFQSRS